MIATDIECKYKYTQEELREICDSILEDRILKKDNNQKIIKYPEIESIREYLKIFHKGYFERNVSHLQILINVLLQYKKELEKIDIEFIRILVKKELLRLCVPTVDAIEDLIILLDKTKKEFNYSYYFCIGTILESLVAYDKMFDHEIFKYAAVANNTYNIYKAMPIFKEDSFYLQFNLYRFTEFIVAYAYYYSLDPSIISEFLLKFVNNYEEILAKCQVNNMNNNHNDKIDVTNQEINLDYASYLVDYVLSLNGNRKVIL